MTTPATTSATKTASTTQPCQQVGMPHPHPSRLAENQQRGKAGEMGSVVDFMLFFRAPPMGFPGFPRKPKLVTQIQITIPRAFGSETSLKSTCLPQPLKESPPPSRHIEIGLVRGSVQATMQWPVIEAGACMARLRDVLELLSWQPASRVKELLPHRWQAPQRPPDPAGRRQDGFARSFITAPSLVYQAPPGPPPQG